MASSSIPALYNARAAQYDDKTTFHRSLAAEIFRCANPQPGESLLDLACGTGLVSFLFARKLQSGEKKGRIIGVDISHGMLDVARSKLQLDENRGFNIEFLEHDITSLDSVIDGEFDIITICSALVLLPNPGAAIKHWSQFLRRGGRMVVDVPHEKSMLSLKVLSLIAPSFNVSVLGNRNWIIGRESLKELMENTGLQGEVYKTEIFEDIPAKTEPRRTEWGAEEGGRIFENIARSSGFEKMEKKEREQAKAMFEAEWTKLAGNDGRVREEGRLWIGFGYLI